MRALYVNHTSRISGGELSLITLLEALPDAVEPTVACPEGTLADRLRSMGIDVYPIRGTDGSLRLHPTRTPRALIELGQAALQVRKAAATARADLVHANSIRAGIIAIGATSASDRPTIVHVRDCLPSGAVSALTLRTISRADALIANSAYTRSTLGPGKASARVVHNAVDLTRFDRVALSAADARARLDIDESGPVLAVIAQITPWKGQNDAIRIAGALMPTNPGLRLLLIGSPKFDSAATRYDNTAYLESLHNLVAKRDLSGVVRFLGQRDDIPELLRAVDLLLVPSWEEPFGRAIIEAMASRVPVVATGVGGPSEILLDANEHAGLVLPPRNPEAWVPAIGELLADRGRRAEMGRRGREAALRRFGVERHVEEVLDVYEGVLGAAAGRST